MERVRRGDESAPAAPSGLSGDAARIGAAIRAAALAECHEIACAAVGEYGPLTAQGARSVATRIKQLMEAQ